MNNMMTAEDANGGELVGIIRNSQGQSNQIIQGIMTHAPLVAQQLNILDIHYHNTFLKIEQALRVKQDRPDGDLEQLEILAEFNQMVGQHGPRANVKVSLRRHYTEYGVSYGLGHLPREQYLARYGVQKVIGWRAGRTQSGKPCITEYLENGPTEDGFEVVTEVLDVTAMEEVKISEKEFVGMLLNYRDRPADDRPIWHMKRICYTRTPMTSSQNWSWFAHRFPGIFNDKRAPMTYSFQYSYPFWVGERDATVYNVFNDRITEAVCFDTPDDNYSLVFYKSSTNGQLKHLILDRTRHELTSYREEWYVSEYLKNTLDIMASERNDIAIGAYDLSESHPYRTMTVQPDDIPATILVRDSITECVMVSFERPHLINAIHLNHCTHVYAYKTEVDGKISNVHLHFEYVQIEYVDMEQVLNPKSRY